MDTYGKFNKGFEVESSGWYPDDKQLAQGFGDDVLRVSGSCGVGALKGWNAKQKKATHIEPVIERTGRLLRLRPRAHRSRNGSKRLAIRRRPASDMTCRYTLYGGHRDAQVDVFLTNLSAMKSSVPVYKTSKARNHIATTRD